MNEQLYSSVNMRCLAQGLLLRWGVAEALPRARELAADNPHGRFLVDLVASGDPYVCGLFIFDYVNEPTGN